MTWSDAPPEAALRLEENLRLLAGFRLIDDDFMTAFFEDNLVCTELVLRIVLDMPELVVVEVHTQVHAANQPADRAVRMDVVARDSAGRTVNIEIQRAGRGAGSRRARFNSSMLDAALLQKGEDFEQLPETYVVFITERDVLGRGLPVYKIERYILDLDELFDDGAHILYVNGAFRGDTPVGRLMHDFFCTRAEDMYYDALAERMRYFKDTQEGSDTMCRAVEEMMETVRKRSERQNSQRIAQRMLAAGKLAPEEIAEYLDLPLEEVQKLRGAMPQ